MKTNEIPYKIYLSEEEMPRSWYNVRADMKNKPAPLLNPQTFKPITEEELEQVFCKDLVQQELNEMNIKATSKMETMYSMQKLFASKFHKVVPIRNIERYYFNANDENESMKL